MGNIRKDGPFTLLQSECVYHKLVSQLILIISVLEKVLKFGLEI